MSAIKDFLELSKIKCRFDEPGSKVTTLAAGGNIRFLLEPSSNEEVRQLIEFLKVQNLKFHILGAGSNLIVPDSGVENPVIRLGRGFRNYELLSEDSGEGCSVFRVGAAMPLMTLSRELSEKGYSGLEFAGGIPASLGGAVRMNAGAHKGEMSLVIRNVVIIDQQGEIKEISADEISFSYRHCSLPDGVLVLSADLALKKGEPEVISAERKKHLEYRKKTQPLTLPSFGSVFKNPSLDKAAGFLIESVGLKGHAIGGAMISDMHANWIVNPERAAKSSEAIQLIELIKKTVREKTGFELVEEVVYWQASSF